MPLANQFVVVVGAQSTLAFEPALHPSMFVMILIDFLILSIEQRQSTCSMWRRGCGIAATCVISLALVRRCRCLSLFAFFTPLEGVLIGVMNETLVLASGSAIDVVGKTTSNSATTMQAVTWQASNVTLLACGDNAQCDECVFDNAYRNVEPCRWCFNPTTIVGRCIARTDLCFSGSQTSSVIAGAKRGRTTGGRTKY